MEKYIVTDCGHVIAEETAWDFALNAAVVALDEHISKGMDKDFALAQVQITTVTKKVESLCDLFPTF